MKWCMTLLGAVLTVGSLAAQDTPPGGARIDVLNYDLDIELTPENSYLRGTAKVTFQVLEDAVSVPFELNSRISLIQVSDEDGVTYSPSFDNFNSSRMLVRAPEAFKSGSQRTLTFTFDGTLDSEEFAYLDDTPREEKAVVSPDGALLLTTGHWFPSHNLPLDTATSTIRVTVPLGFTAVGPGQSAGIETVGISEVFTWTSEHPLDEFPVAVARYFRQSFDDLEVPMTFYVKEDFNQDLHPLADELEKMALYYKGKLGDAWLAPRLNFVEVGNVRLAATGAWGLTLLEDAVLKAPTPSEVELSRRMALQWWGYGLYLGSGSAVWLQDGFAEYATLQYLESKDPERFNAQLAKLSVEALKYEQRAALSAGLELGAGTPQYDSIIRAKGAWVLYMLRQLIGAEKFDPMLDDWYKQSVGKPVLTSQFIDFVNSRSGGDYRWFFVQWVDGTGVPEFRVDYTILKKSAGGFRVRGQIKQDQELFRMPVDIEIQTKGKAEEKHLALRGKSTSFDFDTETLPLKIEIDPDGKILRDSDKMQVAVHIALGEEYQQAGEEVSAIREFEKAKTLFPLSSLAHYRLGETFFSQHSYTNAANSFRDALNGNLQPDWVETWTHIYLGKIYDILDQRQRALAEYQKAVNTKNDYNGAQAEAQKYINEPFSKPRAVIN